MPLQICFSTFGIPQHAAWGIPRSTCSSVRMQMWIMCFFSYLVESKYEKKKTTYLTYLGETSSCASESFISKSSCNFCGSYASLGAVDIQMETRWTSWAPWLSNWVGWLVDVWSMFYDVYMVNVMVIIICLMMVNHMLIVVTDRKRFLCPKAEFVSICTWTLETFETI